MPKTSNATTKSAYDLASFFQGESVPQHPKVSDLDVYLPWACGQLQCKHAVTVVKVTQTEYVSVTAKKKKPKTKPVFSPTSSIELKREKDLNTTFLSDQDEAINIHAIYDNLDHLVELKFDKIKEIPRMIFQILGLIMQFQKFLNTITINRGLDSYSLYEISKFLSSCYITDLCFDNAYLKEGNYYVLFENTTMIRRVSLARCRINDNVLQAIAAKLVHPLPASKTLVILDLSMNLITDKGAECLANVLRSNRCLSYLNLSGNSLTDNGGYYLLDTLVEFPLTSEELTTSRERIMSYLRKRNELITQTYKDLRLSEQTKGGRKRSVKAQMLGKKPLEKEVSVREVKDVFDMDRILYDKACIIVQSQMGKYKDPFSKDNLVTYDDIVYCLGNNTLCYLNLSFNNLTYLSLKKLADVVVTQKINNRKPIGLINVCIDGNQLPVTCTEFITISGILQSTSDKNASKKRTTSKSFASAR